MRTFVTGCVLGALILFAPLSSTAQDHPEAVRLFEQALTAYNAGQWAEAATGFMQAYQVQPEAVFLYNAAKARGALAGDDPAKLEAAKKLLERAQAQTTRPLNERLQVKAVEYHGELTAKIAQAQRLQAKRRQAELDALQSTSEREPRIGQVGWTGVGVFAAGVASMGLVRLFHRNVLVAQEELEGPDSSRAAYEELSDDFTSNQAAGRGALYIGSALLLAGTGLLVWEFATPRDHDAPREDAQPKASRRGRVRLGVTPRSARLEVKF